jgi:hypothetical protein
MPLIKMDIVKGRSEAEIKALLHAPCSGLSGCNHATAIRS